MGIINRPAPTSKLARRAPGVAAGALLPALVAMAWIPLRRSLPNTDVALVLVATIPVAARLGDRIASILGSVSAAVSFGYLHTAPFGHWQIAHAHDVVTTVLIVLVGIFVGDLTLRVFHHRTVADRGSRDLAVLAETAELMAVGDDPGLVLAAVAGELQRLLDLQDCQFAAGPPAGECGRVERDGSLTGSGNSWDRGALDLPVWVQGQVLGHYHLALTARTVPAPDRLAFAVSLADQAGAALAVAPPVPPWHPSEPRLRLVGSRHEPSGPGGEASGPGPGGVGDARRAERTAPARAG